MASTTSYRLFVVCAPGLEELLARELSSLGVKPEVALGGVECRGDSATLARVSFSSRLAESVRIRLKEFVARDFSELEKQLRTLPFRAFFEVGAAVAVKVVCKKSRLWHSGAVKERVERVLREHVGLAILSEEGAHVVHLRLDDDHVQVSIDASGERLHKRGYRTHVERASLRETLAAALVFSVSDKLKANDGELALWDPFCGAGTIVIEAASFARGVLSGVGRPHAFTRFRSFDVRATEELTESLIGAARAGAPLPNLRPIGSDSSEKALESARHNAAAAGLGEHCQFEAGDIEEVAARIPKGAIVLTNPPYGKRLKEAGAVKKLLRVVAARPDLRPVVALVGGSAREVVPKDRPALFRTKSGGIPVSARLLRG